jgi:hypothetical protein
MLTNERTLAGVLSQVDAPQICSSEPGFATTMPSLLYGRVADNGCQRHAEASGILLRRDCTTHQPSAASGPRKTIYRLRQPSGT